MRMCYHEGIIHILKLCIPTEAKLMMLIPEMIIHITINMIFIDLEAKVLVNDA